jgi:hypothetical protein
MAKKVKSEYKYRLREKVIYLGNLYESYHNRIATVKSRKKQKDFYRWYVIEFDDGFQLEVKEEWVKMIQIEE